MNKRPNVLKSIRDYLAALSGLDEKPDIELIHRIRLCDEALAQKPIGYMDEGDLRALANGNEHAYSMWATDKGRMVALYTEQVLSEAHVPVELMSVNDTIAEGDGFWRECSGCYESNEGAPPKGAVFSKVFGCYLGSGCSECGGIGAIWDSTDYEAMARFESASSEEPLSQVPFVWTDGAVLAVLRADGDGPFGEDDVQTVRRILVKAEEVRLMCQEARPALNHDLAGDDLPAMRKAFTDMKTKLSAPEKWTAMDHANYFAFFCGGWEYAKSWLARQGNVSDAQGRHVITNFQSETSIENNPADSFKAKPARPSQKLVGRIGIDF